MRNIFIVVLGLVLSGCTATLDYQGIIAYSKADAHIVDLVTQKAHEHQIPVKFAHAVIYTESRYKPNAISHGTYGLGQIKCSTAKGIGFKGQCKDLFDPTINLDYSFKYLRMALDISKGDECQAAALYQAGLDKKLKKSNYCKLVLSRLSLFDFGVSSNR